MQQLDPRTIIVSSLQTIRAHARTFSGKEASVSLRSDHPDRDYWQGLSEQHGMVNTVVDMTNVSKCYTNITCAHMVRAKVYDFVSPQAKIASWLLTEGADTGMGHA